MKRPLMSKTQNACLIILCILFLLLGIIMVREVLAKRTKEKEYQTIDIKDKMVTDAMQNWNLDFCKYEEQLIKEMFSKNFKIENISKEDAFHILLNQTEELQNCNEKKELEKTLPELNDELKHIVDIELTDEDIEKIINNQQQNSIYNVSKEGEKIIITNNCVLCKDESNVIEIKIEKAEENGKYLHVDVKYAYGNVKLNDENISVIDYYKDIDAKQHIERLTKEDKGKVIWDNYDTIRFTFLIDNQDYLLKSIE